MTPFRTQLPVGVFCALAWSVVTVALLGAGETVRSQESQTAPRQPAPAQEGARGGGPRRAPVAPLGAGPWDLDTEKQRIRVTVVANGLDHPWGMAFLPDGGMLVTERPGRLRVIRDGLLEPAPIGGLPAIRAALIGGLLDIALHPSFEQNRLIYFAYSKPDSDDPELTTLAVARARWDGGATLVNVEDVFVAGDWYSAEMASSLNRCCGQGPAGGSYGSRIVFDADGLLYITSGDRNWGERAQDPSSHLGKIVRIRDDGTIPLDNPFLGVDGYNPDLYTIGHRNPLGLTIHPATGELWSTEFGPRGGDELNRIEAGKNYGWILVTEGTHYNEEPAALGKNSVASMEDPVLFWAPSINPGNLVFYDGERFPEWRGDMLMAAMSRSLLRASFDDAGKPVGQERMLTELEQRLRDVRQGPDGLLYLLTDETAGAVLRIEPAD
jgi:glucose/arabinose dehydrogenase